MEPHATVAHHEGDRITLWAGTQEPFTLREHLAEIFRLPLSKIRIIVPYVGGGYGGKLAVKTEPLAVMLSWKAKRPVRLAHTIEESFKTVTRHPARVRIKTGVTKDGKLVARQCLIHMETGAYADAGPRVTQKAGYRSFGPYRIPHMKTDAYTVYTNTVPAGAYRGFGTLQVTWAYESQMDIIADKVGLRCPRIPHQESAQKRRPVHARGHAGGLRPQSRFAASRRRNRLEAKDYQAAIAAAAWRCA